MLVAMNCGTGHGIVHFAKHYNKSGQFGTLMGTTFVVTIVSSAIVACIALTLLTPFFWSILYRQEVYWLVGFTLFMAQNQCQAVKKV